MDEIPQKTVSLRSQSAWLFLAKIIGFGFSFTLPLLVVRFLTQEQVGIYQQIFKILVNSVAILPLGFSMSAYYFLSREAKQKPFAVFNILLFNFVMGGIAFLIFCFYPQLIGNIFQSPEITRLLPTLGIVVWFWIFSSFLDTAALANQETKIATVFIVFSQFTKAVLMVAAVIFFAKVEALIYAALIQGIIQTIVLFLYLKSRFPKFWGSFDKNFFLQQAIYAIPFGISGLIWTLQIDIHNYFIGSRFSPSEYAVYAVGCFQLPLISIISESATAVLIPRMSELQLESNKREMIELTARVMQKLAFFYFPLYVFLMITAQTFITTLFTEKFSASIPIFLVNLTLLPFYIWVTDPIARAFKEIGRFLFVFRVIVFAVIVSVLWFAIHNFTMLGMILTVVTISLIELSIVSFVVLKKIGTRFSDVILLKNVGKTAIAAAIAGAITFIVYRNTQGLLPILNEQFSQIFNQTFSHLLAGISVLMISAIVFGLIYLISSSYLCVISSEEKQFINEKWLTVKKVVGFETTAHCSLPTDN
jgi:O-antigen/teichoic acid export membrane protein